MNELLRPTENATDVYEVTMALAQSLIPPLSVLKPFIDMQIRKRLEAGQQLLLAEIKSRGLAVTSEEGYAYYVPMAYRFFEQVRLGEYEHNLRVLAALIAGQMERPDADMGAVGRAARKLEMLPLPALFALSRSERAFEIYAATDRDEYRRSLEWPHSIDEHNLVASYNEVGHDLSVWEAQELLFELASRGIMTIGARPAEIGGQTYYRNSAYNEIVAAARDVAL